ncbi:MAG: C4-dicarboxylate TRAP transporter substrate-binding protein [Hyphomicrobiaceae bacterium]
MKNHIRLATCAALTALLCTEAIATEWNVSLWGKRRAFTEHIERLAELVSERTSGTFKLKIFYGGLSNARENLDGISIGAFEMAQFCAGYHRDKNPSITLLELPFLGVTSLQQERELSMALYKHPAVQADMAYWNATLLMPSPMPQYNLIGLGKIPTTLTDFKGLTVRATGGIGMAMQAIGAVPTSMSSAEVRQAMDSGVIRAASLAPHAHLSFGTIENAKWWTTNLNPGTLNCPVVVNTKALNELSEPHREALLGAVDDALDYYIDYYNKKTMSAWGPALDKRSVKRVTFTEEEIAAFQKAGGAPTAEAWIKENTARGLPAKELYDLISGMIAQKRN